MTAVPRHVYDSRGGVTRYKTQMALVRLDPGAGFGISMTSSGLQITATVAWAQISYVPTPVVNDWIDGVNERYAYLEDAQLASFVSCDRGCLPVLTAPSASEPVPVFAGSDRSHGLRSIGIDER